MKGIQKDLTNTGATWNHIPMAGLHSSGCFLTTTNCQSTRKHINSSACNCFQTLTDQLLQHSATCYVCVIDAWDINIESGSKKRLLFCFMDDATTDIFSSVVFKVLIYCESTPHATLLKVNFRRTVLHSFGLVDRTVLRFLFRRSQWPACSWNEPLA